MFEDNKDFYPTPKKLINKMLDSIEDINWHKISTVIEPSAGSGVLAEAVLNRMKSLRSSYYRSRDEKKYDIDCIEIDPNLRYILQGKGFRVVHDDFLTYDGYKKYDILIANYPFSCGEKHALRGLEVMKQGGHLVFLLNSETIKNPYSNTRKDLVRKLNEYNASIEYLQEEFVDAERSTNVEVALIKLTIPETKRDSVILEQLKQEEIYNQQHNKENNTLIEGDFLKGIIQQYKLELKAGLNLINEFYSLQPLILKSFKQDKYTGSILNLSVDGSKYDNSGDTLVNQYIKKMRYKYWEALFNNENFTQLLTTNLLYEYRQKITDLQDYDFSYYNIKEIQRQMSQNMIKGVEDTILELFQEFSHKYSWDRNIENGNIHYYNGWKSNSAYKINKKVILVLSAYSCITDRLDYSYKFYEKLKDIEKVFDYLQGNKTKNDDNYNLRQVLNDAQDRGQTKNILTKYFLISTFKKGSTHLTFLDEELLKKFNIFGSLKLGFLPPSYSKKRYKDMDKEERQVIDEFEGEENYNKVMLNKDYYLYNPSKILMLE